MPNFLEEDQINSQEEDFIIEATPEQQARYNHLLVIAINYYEDENINNLLNCVRDAENLIDILTTDYFFNKENITFLRSRHRTPETDTALAAEQEKKEKGYAFIGEANHTNIVGVLKGIAETSQQSLKEARRENPAATTKNNYIVWYAGHGVYDEVLDEGYWLPSDARKNDNASYIENSTIRTLIKAIESHHTVLIADSCYSGTLFSAGQQRDVGFPRIYKHPSRWGLTAGRKNQTVSDGELSSPFAEQMIAILAAKNEVWINDLGSQIVKKIGRSETQSPMCEPLVDLKGHDGGQFVFLPKQISELDHWRIAWRSNTRSAYYEFLAKFPDGVYESIALAALNAFAQDRTPATYNEDVIGTYNFIKEHFRAQADSYTVAYIEGKINASLPHDKLESFYNYMEKQPENKFFIDAKLDTLIRGGVPTEPVPLKSGLFTDQRDGNSYRTLVINGQTWMVQNFRYEADEGCWLYNNDLTTVEKYGRLYTWQAALRACPPGWHLPSWDEWKGLIAHFGGLELAYSKLVEGGDSGFAAVMGGYRPESGSEFRLRHNHGYYWSSTPKNSAQSSAIRYAFREDRKKWSAKWVITSWGISCRYIKD